MIRFSICRIGIGFIIATIALVSDAAFAASTLERIRDRHAIVFAYRGGAAPFSFKDRGGNVRGYSVELCTRIAADIQRALKLPQLDVQWIAVDADSRIDAVAAGRADAECGTTTITLSRMERVDFSVPIFVDGAALVVRAKSPVQRVADLKDRRVAVGKPEEGAAAVHDGRADAFAGDRLVITQLLSRYDENALAILPDDFSFEPYGIVVRRDDPEFRLAVNRALVGIYKRGDIDAIFQRWLAPLGKPSALLNAMFYLNSLPE